MIWRRNLLGVALLALLGAYFLFQGARQGESPKEEEAARLFPFRMAEVEAVRLARDGRELLCVRGQNGWALHTPPSLQTPIGPGVMEDFLTNLRRVQVVRVIEDRSERLSDYALERPRAEVGLKVRGSEAFRTLLLGESNPSQTCLYARWRGSPRVFLVGVLLEWDLQKALLKIENPDKPGRSGRR